MSTDGTNQKPERDKNGEKILRTFNPHCPSCVYEKVHTPEHWTQHHPEAGQGVDNFGNRKKK